MEKKQMKSARFRKSMSATLVAVGSIIFQGCFGTDSNGESNKPNPPSTYNFDNVDFSGQTVRLDMLAEMTAYLKTGNTQGTVLDAAKLRAMYSNAGSPFSDAALNTSGKDLKSKTFELDQGIFETYFDSIAMASQSTDSASNGTAGVLFSADGGKQYLVSANGVEYTQLIEKGLMGACFYYQAADVYLNPDRKLAESEDNETITPGQGTPMQHHWDEAYGYFTSSTDFPAEGTDRFWGKYSNSHDPVLGTNAAVLNALIKGRHAINNKDRDLMLEAVTEVRSAWETVVAASAIHYLNAARSSLSDDASRNHQLSEAIAFLRSLKYNPERKITLAQLAQVEAHIGPNLYEVTANGLLEARDLLSSIYGMDADKDRI